MLLKVSSYRGLFGFREEQDAHSRWTRESHSDPGIETAGVDIAETSGAELFSELIQVTTSYGFVKAQYRV